MNNIGNIMYLSKIFNLNIDIQLIDSFSNILSNNLISNQLYFFEKN
jgi:hypothetical protein